MVFTSKHFTAPTKELQIEDIVPPGVAIRIPFGGLVGVTIPIELWDIICENDDNFDPADELWMKKGDNIIVMSELLQQITDNEGDMSVHPSCREGFTDIWAEFTSLKFISFTQCIG